MKATEIEFLRWFYQQADFGPSDAEIVFFLKEKFKRETKKELPVGYDEEYVGVQK